MEVRRSFIWFLETSSGKLRPGVQHASNTMLPPMVDLFLCPSCSLSPFLTFQKFSAISQGNRLLHDPVPSSAETRKELSLKEVWEREGEGEREGETETERQRDRESSKGLLYYWRYCQIRLMQGVDRTSYFAPKIYLICCPQVNIQLIIIDTTFDLSQKAKKQ